MQKSPLTDPPAPAHSADHHAFKLPAYSTVTPGRAGRTGEKAEKVPTTAGTPPLLLPGLEGYITAPEPLPFELDNSSESLTEKINQILSSPSRRGFADLEHWQREYIRLWEEENGMGVGACINIFPSGEITGGCYSLGLKRAAPGRSGKIKSTEFTRQARKKIRRAVESKVTTFKLFITLTFDPKLSVLAESGSVDQEWAKDKFKTFLNTLKKRYDRMADKVEKENWRLSYIWVAEIQEQNTKNIHFHMLVDRQFIDVKWLVKIWGQAKNSVNVKRLNNQEHAVNYMLKYMQKGNCPIEGKRYGMTQNLIEGSKPRKMDFYGRDKRNAFLRIKEELEWLIGKNGGHVADWGLSLPPPRREKVWKDRNGHVRTSPGTSRKIGNDLMARIEAAMIALEEVGGDDPLPALVDVPF